VPINVNREAKRQALLGLGCRAPVSALYRQLLRNSGPSLPLSTLERKLTNQAEPTVASALALPGRHEKLRSEVRQPAMPYESGGGCCRDQRREVPVTEVSSASQLVSQRETGVEGRGHATPFKNHRDHREQLSIIPKAVARIVFGGILSGGFMSHGR
jgi:hypothetical protein